MSDYYMDEGGIKGPLPLSEIAEKVKQCDFEPNVMVRAVKNGDWTLLSKETERIGKWKRRTRRVLNPIVLAVAAVLIIAFLEIRPYLNQRIVYSHATDVVRNALKTPSVAQFGSFGDAVCTRYPDHWVIRGVVDSQNGFGAMVRSQFVCKIPCDDKGVSLRVHEATVEIY